MKSDDEANSSGLNEKRAGGGGASHPSFIHSSSNLSNDAASKVIRTENGLVFTDNDESLGEGGFGIVRKAQYKGQTVAVKSLKVNETVDGRNNSKLHSMELFVAEAKKMAQISHPRIVEFLGFVMESFSIIMEFMSEGTLADYLKQNRGKDIPWSVRYWFAADIAEGMAYLHSKKGANGKFKVEVFHQDLKPANVLLSLENGELRCKISDLGLAAIKRASNEDGSDGKLSKIEQQTNMMTSFVDHQGGTYAYMAPELTTGGSRVSGKPNLE